MITIGLISQFDAVKKTWQKFKTVQQELFNFLVLHVVFFLGIGVTAVFAKFVGKKFLINKYYKSSWKKAGTCLPFEPDHMF